MLVVVDRLVAAELRSGVGFADFRGDGIDGAVRQVHGDVGGAEGVVDDAPVCIEGARRGGRQMEVVEQP
jgi:hypothetical protein